MDKELLEKRIIELEDIMMHSFDSVVVREEFERELVRIREYLKYCK